MQKEAKPTGNLKTRHVDKCAGFACAYSKVNWRKNVRGLSDERWSRGARATLPQGRFNKRFIAYPEK